jgi:O-antigen/teichoic acid export membrane protein
MTPLKKLAIRGTLWTLIGYGASQLLRLGSNLILTRLLVPELFGLMALVYVFIIGLEMLSDVGIGPSVIQNPRGNEIKFLNTAWTIQVIRGLCLWICSFLIAIPAADFYQEKSLIWLIPLVGFSSAIAGFNSTSLFTLNREIALAKLTLIELGTQLSGLITMIVWAFFNPTIWALVAGNFVSTLLKMVISHQLIAEKPNRFAWHKEFVGEIFSFSQWVFVSSMMTFLATQVDKLLLGKLFSFTLLGVYQIALTFAEIPQKIIYSVAGRVIFPVIAQQADLPRETLRAKILQNRQKIVLGLIPCLAIFICFGDFLVLFLYDVRYEEAAWMLPILALGFWPHLLTMTMYYVLLGLGKPAYGAMGFFAKLCYMIGAVLLGYKLGGILGVIIAIALNDLPLYAVVSYGCWKEKITTFQQDLMATIVLIVTITLILSGRYYLGLGFPFDKLTS